MGLLIFKNQQSKRKPCLIDQGMKRLNEVGISP